MAEGTMIKIDALAVGKGKGLTVGLEVESREGSGTLFLDARLCEDKETLEVINNAFNLLRVKKLDIIVRKCEEDKDCLCGGSLGLPVYLGMFACARGLKLKPNIFATGFVDRRGNITQVDGLAEKIRAILGKADTLLVPKGQGLPVSGLNVREVSNVKSAVKLAVIS